MKDVLILQALCPDTLEVERVGCGEEPPPGVDLRRRGAADVVELARFVVQVVLRSGCLQFFAANEMREPDIPAGFGVRRCLVVVDLVGLENHVRGLYLGVSAEVVHGAKLLLIDCANQYYVLRRGVRPDRFELLLRRR